MQLKEPLRSSRITVRDYRASDLPDILAMWFDEETGKYMIDPSPEYVDASYRAALEELEDHPDGYYLTVTLADSQEIVGTMCLFPDKEWKTFDIGYCVHKRLWRQGYGSELIALAIDWVRAHGGREITAEVAKENTASNRLLRKFGFEPIRETSFKKYNMDVHFDSYIYRLAL